MNSDVLVRLVPGFSNSLFRKSDQVWTTVTGTEAGDALIAIVTGSAKLDVFGAPYATGNGMHDVHCNQGDPKGSQWYPSNGAWQDGFDALNNDNTYSIYLGMFLNPRLNTDAKWKPGLGLPMKRHSMARQNG